MHSKHEEIFEACSANPPNLDSVKLAIKRLKRKEVLHVVTGDTPLHVALMHGADLELVEYLVSINKSMVKTPNLKMILPIHLACNGPNASAEIVSFLVDQWNDSLKKCTLLGNVPLHVACATRAPLSVVRYLSQQHDCAKTTFNRKKQTPMDCALSEDKGKAILDVVKFLRGDMTIVERQSTQAIREKDLPIKKTAPSALDLYYGDFDDSSVVSASSITVETSASVSVAYKKTQAIKNTHVKPISTSIPTALDSYYDDLDDSTSVSASSITVDTSRSFSVADKKVQVIWKTDSKSFRKTAPMAPKCDDLEDSTYFSGSSITVDTF